jgi:hypothetical protein
MRTLWLAIVGIAIWIGSWAATVQAGVVINSVKGPSALVGHSLWTLTAVSDNPNEPILGFDFSGDPDNNDPATGLGFFGSMGQVNPVNIATVYQDNNVFFPLVGRNVNEDSQFLFNSNAVVPSAPASQEGPNILQATFAFADPQGLSVPFVQLVLPDRDSNISFRGDVLVGQSGQGTNRRVQSIGTPPLDFAPSVANLSDATDFFGETINLQPVDSVPGTPPVTWSELAGPTYTPGFGARPDAPGLGSATWTWNPATQAFQFKTLGATAGRYVWEGSASNAFGSDSYSISVDVYVGIIPEPATAVFVGLIALAIGVVRIPRNEAARSAENTCGGGHSDAD